MSSARLLPGKQFEVSRALRARITLAFAHDGISLPARPGIRRTDRSRPVTRQLPVRVSTLDLAVVFEVTPAVYVLVRPQPAAPA